MAINYETLFDLEALAGLQNRLPPDVAKNIPTGPGGFLKTIVNMANASQQQEPQLGPDDFGSYTIPDSDPTYSSGFDYARSIAGGIPMSQVIAPGVSYSPEQPMGYTQEQLNIPRDVEKLTPPAITYETPDDPTYFGTGIGGVNIPVDRDMKMPPLRDIFGSRRDTSSLENLMNIGKLFNGGIDQDAINRIVQERIAKRPMISGLENRDLMDVDSLITGIPTGRDFSVNREPIPLQDFGYGPGIMPPTPPMDIDKLIPPVDLPPINITDLPPVDLPPINIPPRTPLDLPTVRPPTKMDELTGGRFSINQQRPMGLF